MICVILVLVKKLWVLMNRSRVRGLLLAMVHILEVFLILVEASKPLYGGCRQTSGVLAHALHSGQWHIGERVPMLVHTPCSRRLHLPGLSGSLAGQQLFHQLLARGFLSVWAIYFILLLNVRMDAAQ